jgi:hypothetical protein
VLQRISLKNGLYKIVESGRDSASWRIHTSTSTMVTNQPDYKLFYEYNRSKTLLLTEIVNKFGVVLNLIQYLKSIFLIRPKASSFDGTIIHVQHIYEGSWRTKRQSENTLISETSAQDLSVKKNLNGVCTL